MKKKLLLAFLIFLSPHFKAQDTQVAENNLVYILPMLSNINSTTWVHTQRAFAEAREANAKAIIIHLNTYGGEVVFADSIRTKILNSPIPVHVFIDNNAASAGALISIAADKIFMRPGANIGAATVVNQTGEEMPDKFQSYMRSTLRATAEAHGKDTIVTGNDTIVKWVRDPRIAEAMVDESIAIPGITEEGEVLTFTTLEAKEHGFCDGVANNLDEVINQLGIADPNVQTFRPSFADNLKGFVTSPVLRGILILLILAGIYFEMQSPGIGFPLAIAIGAAVLYFAPLYIDGLAANWEIILFVIGIALIAVEIFVFPGFGVAGVSGIVLAVTGLTLSLVDNVIFDFSNVDPTTFLEALLTVVSGMAGALLLIIYLSNRFSKAKGPISKIALQTTQDIQLGYIGVDQEMKNLVGKKGVTATILRPGGKVIVDDEMHDAMCTEGYIEKGEKIVVTSFKTGQLLVRKENV